MIRILLLGVSVFLLIMFVLLVVILFLVLSRKNQGNGAGMAKEKDKFEVGSGAKAVGSGAVGSGAAGSKASQIKASQIKAAADVDDEITAVISAAIAAMDTIQGFKMVVKNIRRVPQASPVWNSVGRVERFGRKLNSL